jgi:hypothetical protein
VPFVLLWYRKEFGMTVNLNVAELELQYGIKVPLSCCLSGGVTDAA